MKEPEVEARHGGVIARVAQVEKSQQLFVDEVKPEEAVILASAAVQGKGEIRRVRERRQNVPGSGDEQDDGYAGQGIKALPGRQRRRAGG